MVTQLQTRCHKQPCGRLLESKSRACPPTLYSMSPRGTGLAPSTSLRAVEDAETTRSHKYNHGSHYYYDNISTWPIYDIFGTG